MRDVGVRRERQRQQLQRVPQPLVAQALHHRRHGLHDQRPVLGGRWRVHLHFPEDHPAEDEACDTQRRQLLTHRLRRVHELQQLRKVRQSQRRQQRLCSRCWCGWGRGGAGGRRLARCVSGLGRQQVVQQPGCQVKVGVAGRRHDALLRCACRRAGGRAGACQRGWQVRAARAGWQLRSVARTRARVLQPAWPHKPLGSRPAAPQLGLTG